MRNRIYKRILLLVAILLFVVSFLQMESGIAAVLKRSHLIDFSVYYHAGETVMKSHNPYTVTYGNNILFNYPPSSLLIFIPFAFFYQQQSEIIFTALSIICILLSGFLMTGGYPYKLNRALRLVILATLMQNFPTKFTLTLGQINLIVLLFIILAWVLDQNRKPVLSGICFGIAAMVKLTPLILGIYYLSRKNLKAFFTGITVLILTNIPFLIILAKQPTFFSKNLPELLFQTVMTTSVYNQSMRIFLTRIGLQNTASFLTVIVIGIIVLFALKKYQMYQSVQQKTLDTNFRLFSVLLILITIGNAYTWQHHLVFLFPGFIATTVAVIHRNDYLKGIFLVISALLVGMHFPDIAHPPTNNPFILSHSLIGSLLLIFLLLNLKTAQQTNQQS